jgi:hypothetical protein
VDFFGPFHGRGLVWLEAGGGPAGRLVHEFRGAGSTEGAVRGDFGAAGGAEVVTSDSLQSGGCFGDHPIDNGHD